MKVSDLIAKLEEFPGDAEVFTNECEATPSHEEIVPLDTVALVADDSAAAAPYRFHVYAGTYSAR